MPMDHSHFRARFSAAERMSWRGKVHDFGRPLLQLALPGPGAVGLWSLCREGRAPTATTVTVGVSDATGRETTSRRLVFTELPCGAARASIDGLRPGQRYRLEVDSDGGRTTLAAATAPGPSDRQEFRFLAFSCFSPYAGRDGQISNATAHCLGLLQARGEQNPPAFMLAMGDQVYVDQEGPAPGPMRHRALVHGWRAQKIGYQGSPGPFFDTLYRHWFAIPPFDAALAKIPCAMMWDDHDLRDGWGSQGDENARDAAGGYRWATHLEAARSHFFGYQMLRNATPAAMRAAAGGAEDWPAWHRSMIGVGPPTPRPEFDFSFDWGNLATFFVMDLRSHRDCQRATEDRVISQQQLGRLKTWLTGDARKGRSTLFVLVSPMPLTSVDYHRWSLWRLLPFRRDEWRDNWTAEASRAQHEAILSLLLAHFSENPDHRLLILSGDFHRSEVRQLALADGRVFGQEVVSSGLAQPSISPSFPFTRSGSRSGAGSGSPHPEPRSLLQGRLVSTRVGGFKGAGFAELSVAAPHSSRPPSSPPEVGFLFHAAAEPTRGGVLLNPTAELHTILGQPLDHLPLAPPALTNNPFPAWQRPRRLVPSYDTAATWDDPLP